MRVLQLMPGNAKGVAMAEQGLRDKDPDVRAIAAVSLGLMKSKSSIAQLHAALKDKEVDVVMAAAKALTELGDEKGYSIYYAVVTGELKSGGGLVASEEKELHQILRNPKEMTELAFEQGIGFVPFGGVGFAAFQAIHRSESKVQVVQAAATKVLAKDPDPSSGKALVAATEDQSWLVRAAAFDALARRGDAGLLPELKPGLNDEKEVVKFTAAATVIHLSSLSKTKAR
jgi:HEAT repeat protein